VRGMVQVWEGRRRVREGRVQWRPLGLEVCQVATNAIVVRYGAGVGGVELVCGAGERAGEVSCSEGGFKIKPQKDATNVIGFTANVSTL
jgi:hypothetical protein